MHNPQQYDISPPRPDEDQALDDALARSLHLPGGTPDWIERLGRAAFRVVRVDDRVAAGIALAPAGMWLGGQRIGCTLINGVGVAPDFRGSGVGRAMMAAVVRELHEARVPLAALYTGFMAPAEVRMISAIDGPAAELGLLGALFSGPRPWIGDMF